MNVIKVLTPILLFCFCWTFQLEAQTVKRKFVNQLDKPITLYVVSEASDGRQTTKQTIEIDGHVGSFRKSSVQIGDFVYAEVKGNPNVRTDRIFINGTRGENEAIPLSPQLTFLDFYGELGNNNQVTRFLGISYNLFGIDITKYRPRRVIDGFTPNQIFKGIGNQLQPSATRSYYLQKIEGTVLPVGFHYTGADSDQDGLMNTSEYHTENAFKKEWNLSVGAAGNVKGVKGSIDFSYGEEFEKTSTQSHVYYIKQQKNKDFRIDTRLNVAEFDDKFIQRVGSIRTQADADQFVQDFGSHYPLAVIYGGMYSQYTSVSKSEFYEAKRKKLSLKVGIEASKTKPTTETTDKSEFEDQKTIRPGKSKSAGGSVGFSQSQSQEMREILSNSNSRYYAIGGSITSSGAGWSASGTQTAIEVELGEITDLIDAKILKSRLTHADLSRYAIKAKVAEAVRKQKAKLKDYENRAERAYEMQVTQIKVAKHIDDADKRGKGFIRARVSGSNKAIPLFEVNNYVEKFNHNSEIQFQDPNERSLANRTWHPFYQRANANGNFPTLTVDFSAEMWDSDHCCGNELAEVKWGQIPTKALVPNQPYTHKLFFKDTDHLVLQDWAIEATILIRPVDPLSVQRRSANRSASSKLTKKVVKYQPPTMTENAFKSAATTGGGPTKLVKFYKKAGVNVAQAKSLAAQMGGKLATSYEVQAAFQQHKLDVYAFGLMADGRFAVPVQKDHSNFKKGPNIGAVGGNQGFFYTAPEKTSTTPAKTTSSSPAATNIALKKPAKQSSNYGNQPHKFGANFANDGDIYNQNKGGNIIMCTNQETNPWWEVDLQGTYNIKEIKLYNRINCCPDRLANFTILVSSTPFTANFGGTVFTKNQAAPSGQGGKGSYTGNATGRYVRLYLENSNYLSIPEIEIYGTATTAVIPPTSSNPVKPVSPGFVRIQNSWKKTHYIHNQNGKIEDGLIQANATSDWWSAQWKIIPAEHGFVRIQNKWKPDQYLHKRNGKLEVGQIQNNWVSATWKIVPVHSGWARIQNGRFQLQYLHNQNGKIEVGEIDPNWASAMWKVE